MEFGLNCKINLLNGRLCFCHAAGWILMGNKLESTMASLFECTGNTRLLSSYRLHTVSWYYMSRSHKWSQTGNVCSVFEWQNRWTQKSVLILEAWRGQHRWGSVWILVNCERLLKKIFCLESNLLNIYSALKSCSFIGFQWLAVGSLVNMRLGNYDFYILALCPIEPQVNSSVSPLP